MNKKAFQAIASKIEETGRFNLNFYIGAPDGKKGAEVFDETCGTTACIAGWANYLVLGRPIDEDEALDIGKAAKFLGINDDQAQRLFYAFHDSVWCEVAVRFEWETWDGEIVGWERISPQQAATVMREIASGKIKL